MTTSIKILCINYVGCDQKLKNWNTEKLKKKKKNEKSNKSRNIINFVAIILPLRIEVKMQRETKKSYDESLRATLLQIRPTVHIHIHIQQQR